MMVAKNATNIIKRIWVPIMRPPDDPNQKFQWTKMSQKDLDAVLDRHEKFADNKGGGERAKLSMYDLSYLDFTGRNLSRADFTGSLLC